MPFQLKQSCKCWTRDIYNPYLWVYRATILLKILLKKTDWFMHVSHVV